MRSIEIDEEVFAHLQKHARAFVDSPNSTCRRLFGIDPADSLVRNGRTGASAHLNELLSEGHTLAAGRSKAPKADLGMLVQKGLLRNGQQLYLVDYQGNRVKNFCAAVSHGDLIYNGRRYSMSSLAQELLAEIGFKSNSVRGPAHWVNDEGKSIKELWQQLSNRSDEK